MLELSHGRVRELWRASSQNTARQISWDRRRRGMGLLGVQISNAMITDITKSPYFKKRLYTT